MVSRGHPWSSGRAPSWDCHPWSLGRGAMVVIAYFMGGGGVAWGSPLPLRALANLVPSSEEATSPTRDRSLSNSCGRV